MARPTETNVRTEWVSAQTPWIWILVILYLLVVKVCPHRVPVLKHGLLPAWYYVIGILQLILLVAFLPEMTIAFSEGWTASVCRSESLYSGSFTGTIVLLFVISKAVDLIETLLILTEGRNPLDIHVFHHTVTLLYVWHSYVQESSIARWFVFMNLLSHVVLHAYLSPKKFGFRPCWLSVAITQMLSLVVCLLATFTAQRVIDEGGKCDVGYNRLSLDKLAIVIFIIIFADFYHQKCREFRIKIGINNAYGPKVLVRSNNRLTLNQTEQVYKKPCGITTGINARFDD